MKIYELTTKELKELIDDLARKGVIAKKTNDDVVSVAISAHLQVCKVYDITALATEAEIDFAKNRPKVA